MSLRSEIGRLRDVLGGDGDCPGCHGWPDGMFPRPSERGPLTETEREALTPRCPVCGLTPYDYGRPNLIVVNPPTEVP